MATAGAIVVKLSLELRWWVLPYLGALALVAHVMQAVPDFEKVQAFIVRRGIVVRVRRG